jgi:hypothetical protein
MRRSDVIRRALITISYLAALATAILTAASFLPSRDEFYWLDEQACGLRWGGWTAIRGQLEFWAYREIDASETMPNRSLELLGAGFRARTVRIPYTDLVLFVRSFRMPLWLPLLLLLATPTAAVIRGPIRRCRRRRKGCCVRCGYDLTGNVTGVCPECGTAR